jgi:hypothetical protein
MSGSGSIEGGDVANDRMTYRLPVKSYEFGVMS